MALIPSVSAEILEGSTPRVTATIVDDTGVGIPAASLTDLTLTLFVADRQHIINSRDGQNVLNTNNVTVDSNGNLVWSVQAADTTMRDQSRSQETHRAIFAWSWN